MNLISVLFYIYFPSYARELFSRAPKTINLTALWTINSYKSKSARIFSFKIAIPTEHMGKFLLGVRGLTRLERDQIPALKEWEWSEEVFGGFAGWEVNTVDDSSVEVYVCS